jgi:ADP-heptose:LPS heptosyltransferase
MSDLRTIQRIAVFRALQLGDLIQAVPALRALRAAFPCAEITLVGLPWARSFVERCSRYIDRFVEFPGFPGIAEREVVGERTARFIAEQRSYAYDLAIQMHGSGRTSNRVARALGAQMTAGYFEGCNEGALTFAAPYPDDQPEVYRNLGLIKLLGYPADDPTLEFPLDAGDYAEAAALLPREQDAMRPRIGIHVGARAPSRRWPTSYFATLADELAHLWHAQIILTGNTDELSTVRSVEEQMTTRPLNLAGKTSLGGLAAIIANLDLFISNDTGPAHIASALGTASIIIFGPADYRRWAPLDQSLHRIMRHPVACSPCGYRDCPIDHRCLRKISPESGLKAAGELLAKGAIV